MKRQTWLKWSIPVVMAGALGAGMAQADDDKRPSYGYGMMGPGMMGGGYGMMGRGWGPGMMYDDDGMSPYGYGMPGPGMMSGGYGMMGGFGMGHGMMGGMMPGPVWMLELDDKQRRAIDDIMSEQHRQHWAMMTSQFGEYGKLQELYRAERLDAEAIDKVYERIFKAQRAMIESGIKARNRIHEQLTKEQREALQRYQWPGQWPGRWGR